MFGSKMVFLCLLVMGCGFLCIGCKKGNDSIQPSSVKSIFLYHDDQTSEITSDQDLFKDLVCELSKLLRNKEYEDGIDEGIGVYGYERPVVKWREGYYLEVNFTEPQRIKFPDRPSEKDVYSFILFLDETYLYILYEERSETKINVFTGCCYTEAGFEPLRTLIHNREQ